MLDEIKLIYFYQLEAEGFRPRDTLDNEEFLPIILDITENPPGRDYYRDPQITITPQLMSELVLLRLCGRVV